MWWKRRGNTGRKWNQYLVRLLQHNGVRRKEFLWSFLHRLSLARRRFFPVFFFFDMPCQTLCRRVCFNPLIREGKEGGQGQLVEKKKVLFCSCDMPLLGTEVLWVRKIWIVHKRKTCSVSCAFLWLVEQLARAFPLMLLACEELPHLCPPSPLPPRTECFHMLPATALFCSRELQQAARALLFPVLKTPATDQTQVKFVLSAWYIHVRQMAPVPRGSEV